MTWGTLVEFTFNGNGGIQDFFDFSTNFKESRGGNVFFNIPAAVTAHSGGVPLTTCGNQKGKLEWPVACLAADCPTAYQDPRDRAKKGAQLLCPAGEGSETSYTVEFCPGGI